MGAVHGGQPFALYPFNDLHNPSCFSQEAVSDGVMPQADDVPLQLEERVGACQKQIGNRL